MKDSTVELYSSADLSQLEHRIKRWSLALFLLATAALAVCVVLITLTGTENAARMETLTIAVSTVAGWIVIYGSLFVIVVSRRELSHANMLRNDERQMVSGDITVTDELVKIRRSITARRVEVHSDEGIRRLLVCDTRTDALAAAGATALYTVHGYIAAYEVSL